MKRFKIPTYDWEIVRRLSRHPDARKSKLWERTGGDIGRFKATVTNFLKSEQQRKCAYCMSYLHEKLPARDHIAPKADYPMWTFRPDNLVLACYACNTDNKKTYDPISIRHRKYKRCQFKIIHPYFDKPGAHLDYSIGGSRKILIAGITDKGDETIRLFDLMTPERAKQRAADALVEEFPNQLQQRLQEIYVPVVRMRSPLKPATRIAPTRL